MARGDSRRTWKMRRRRSQAKHKARARGWQIAIKATNGGAVALPLGDPGPGPGWGYGISMILEDDILAELARLGLQANKDAAKWRGADGTIGGRYVWWPRVRGRIRCLHLGMYRADTPITRPIENGNVRHELEFRGVERTLALAALRRALLLLASEGSGSE